MKRFTAGRRRVVVPLLVLTALALVGVATVTASASTRRADATTGCSLAGIAGAWGHNFDGWTTQGVLTPSSGTGRTTVDGQGNVSGTETTTWFGQPSTLSITGTLSVNADCTGTISNSLFNQSNALVFTEVWAVVFVDNQTAMRGTLTMLASGPSRFNQQGATGTLNADKLFPVSGPPPPPSS
jgi:hypothetical protein